MKSFRITYIMYPDENIEVICTAKTEEEAVIYAKNYRKDAFKIEELNQED